MPHTLGGWSPRFDEVAWTVIAARFRVMSDEHPQFTHMTAIVDSVLASGVEQHLAGLTSMHDLVVTARPLPEQPPIEVVLVRSPSSLVSIQDGHVMIEHRSGTGRDDRIVRPSADAVPLFWRFVAEKFGIRATRPGSVV